MKNGGKNKSFAFIFLFSVIALCNIKKHVSNLFILAESEEKGILGF